MGYRWQMMRRRQTEETIALYEVSAMSAAQHRRLRALEVARESSGSTPAYICVQSVEEIPAALAAIGKRVHVYVGVCPDDWDTDDEQSSSNAPAESA